MNKIVIQVRSPGDNWFTVWDTRGGKEYPYWDVLGCRLTKFFTKNLARKHDPNFGWVDEYHKEIKK